MKINMELDISEDLTLPNATSSSSMDVEAIDEIVDNQGWSVSGIENSALVRTVYGIIGFSGMAGNALVCFVLIRVPALRTRTSQFIINLAIADFLTSFWLIPFHMFPRVPPVSNGFSGELTCRLYISKYILWVSAIVSIYCLVAVTLERYVAAVHPLKYKRIFTTKFSVLVAVCCWTIGILSPVFFFFIYDVRHGSCVFLPYPSKAHQMVVGVFIFMVIYAIPIVFLLVWHSQIIRSLRRQARTLAVNIAEHRETAQRNRRRNENNNDCRINESGGTCSVVINVNNDNNRWHLKVANDMQKTFLIVIIVFILCWAPNQFLFLSYSLGAPVDFTKTYYHFSVILAVCNSCVNPFIYVFKNKIFRRGIFPAFQCSNRRSTEEPCRQFENTIQPQSSLFKQQDGSDQTTAVSIS